MTHFTSTVASFIYAGLDLKTIRPGPFRSNHLYGCHEMEVGLNGDGTKYRVIVAPVDAPIEIGGVPIDEHFGGSDG